GRVDAPGFEIAHCAVFEEHLGSLRGHFAVFLTLGVRDRENDAIDVAAPWLAGVDDRLEPAIDHALAVERHVVAELVHPRVFHHLFVAGLRGGLVGPGDPREHHLLAVFQRHGAAKVGLLAVADVGFPRLDMLDRAVVVRDRPELLGDPAIGIALVGGHRNDESLQVHDRSPQAGCSVLKAASWAASAAWNAGRASPRSRQRRRPGVSASRSAPPMRRIVTMAMSAIENSPANQSRVPSAWSRRWSFWAMARRSPGLRCFAHGLPAAKIMTLASSRNSGSTLLNPAN